MLKNKKILLVAIVPILLFGGYTMTKAKPVVKEKVKGTIYVMPQSFLLNLSDGRYAKMSVALELAPGQSDGASATARLLRFRKWARYSARGSDRARNHHQRRDRPERRNAHQQPRPRSDQASDPPHDSAKTDVKVEEVLFPDFTVQ